ncbi:MAG: manganese efflux pump [Candidatus Aminicenantes bacterium]|nr:MAG: manganese efflux pump [Candidatus Aminicenantes bacterium]RPJ03645.1 MAG: manganese efflux pump [Candidatus Aminicenantes bacterium]
MNPLSFIWILGIAVALAMDCFAITLGLACGARGLTMKQAVRMAAYFGGFQFVMPVAGWLAGDRLLGIIEHFDHWVAFGLLALIGGRMIWESLEMSDGEKDSRPDQTQGKRLLILALATSIDALAVGLSLGVVRTGILYPAAIIGVTSFLLTVAGARLGPVVGRLVGKRAELAGGLILIAIGAKILIEHLVG